MITKRQYTSHGFTLIEVLVALAIYSVLIATLVVVNRNGLQSLSDAESQALARRALSNIVVQFKADVERGKITSHSARHSGSYRMANRIYQWEINVKTSQNRFAKLLSAEIKEADTAKKLATVQGLL